MGTGIMCVYSLFPVWYLLNNPCPPPVLPFPLPGHALTTIVLVSGPLLAPLPLVPLNRVPGRGE